MPSRLLVSMVIALAAWFAAGCAVALGPGYTIEKQRIEVTYSPEKADRVSVRASYQLKNAGKGPLANIQVKIPYKRDFTENLRGEWNGRAMASQPVPGSDDKMQFNSGPEWKQGDRVEFVVAYDLPIVGAKLSGEVLKLSSCFFLPSSGWYPTLLPPPGSFSAGGKPPAKWDLVVSAPGNFHVHASGEERGLEHHNGGPAAPASRLFEQIPERNFDPFVVAGPFVEQQFHSPAGTVNFWSAKPISESDARDLGEHFAYEYAYLKTEFGLKGAAGNQIWIIECPGGAIEPVQPWRFRSTKTGGAWLSRRDCFTEPQSAFVGDFNAKELSAHFAEPYPYEGSTNKSVPIETVSVQLAATWFYFSLREAPDGPAFPMAGAPDYAALAFTLSLDPSSRGDVARKLLQRVEAADPEDRKVQLKSADNSVGSTDSPREIELARVRSELFFIALEDRCGAQNVHHALARVLRILQGQTWNISDLRSAMEAECGADLADFFRQWLNRPGVPEDFRAKYAGATPGK